METLTTMEKIMNMAKLGTVSQLKTAIHSTNLMHEIKGMQGTHYTLCAQKIKAHKLKFIKNCIETNA